MLRRRRCPPSATAPPRARPLLHGPLNTLALLLLGQPALRAPLLRPRLVVRRLALQVEAPQQPLLHGGRGARRHRGAAHQCQPLRARRLLLAGLRGGNTVGGGGLRGCWVSRGAGVQAALPSTPAGTGLVPRRAQLPGQPASQPARPLERRVPQRRAAGRRVGRPPSAPRAAAPGRWRAPRARACAQSSAAGPGGPA